jgi:hypothetical protein
MLSLDRSHDNIVSADAAVHITIPILFGNIADTGFSLVLKRDDYIVADAESQPISADGANTLIVGPDNLPGSTLDPQLSLVNVCFAAL